MEVVKINYKIISDFNHSSSKDCRKADIYNEKLYIKNIELTDKGTKQLEKSGLIINIELETPPRPNNFEKYIQWKKRNSKKPAHEQSEAIIYLYKNGYKLGIDYEAHSAIELVKKLKKSITKSSNKNIINNTFSYEKKETNNLSLCFETIELENDNNIKKIPIASAPSHC